MRSARNPSPPFAERGLCDLTVRPRGACSSRFAPKFAYATAALARVTLALALSHQGRGDLSLAIHT